MKNFVLFYLIVTKEIVFCSYFNTFISSCPLRGNVYSTVTLPSKVFCACLCNAVESCDWILWNGDSNICMFHSFKQSGVPMETTITGFKWIGKKPSSSICNHDGYDYDISTNTCIKLGQSTSGVTWVNARAECQKDGGDLISISTQEKSDFVLDYIDCFDGLWIGFRQGKWVTGDSFLSFVSANVNNWDSGYPAESDPSCGAVHPSWEYKIQDQSCNIRTRTYFVCEIYV